MNVCQRTPYNAPGPHSVIRLDSRITETVQDYIDRGIKKQGRRYKNVTKEGKELFSFLRKTKEATVRDLMDTFDIGRDMTEAWRLGKDVAKSSKKKNK